MAPIVGSGIEIANIFKRRITNMNRIIQAVGNCKLLTLSIQQVVSFFTSNDLGLTPYRLAIHVVVDKMNGTLVEVRWFQFVIGRDGS